MLSGAPTTNIGAGNLPVVIQRFSDGLSHLRRNLVPGIQELKGVPARTARAALALGGHYLDSYFGLPVPVISLSEVYGAGTALTAEGEMERSSFIGRWRTQILQTAFDSACLLAMKIQADGARDAAEAGDPYSAILYGGAGLLTFRVYSAAGAVIHKTLPPNEELWRTYLTEVIPQAVKEAVEGGGYTGDVTSNALKKLWKDVACKELLQTEGFHITMVRNRPGAEALAAKYCAMIKELDDLIHDEACLIEEGEELEERVSELLKSALPRLLHDEWVDVPLDRETVEELGSKVTAFAEELERVLGNDYLNDCLSSQGLTV